MSRRSPPRRLFPRFPPKLRWQMNDWGDARTRQIIVDRALERLEGLVARQGGLTEWQGERLAHKKLAHKKRGL